jgi:hypothetical protein
MNNNYDEILEENKRLEKLITSIRQQTYYLGHIFCDNLKINSKIIRDLNDMYLRCFEYDQGIIN